MNSIAARALRTGAAGSPPAAAVEEDDTESEAAAASAPDPLASAFDDTQSDSALPDEAFDCSAAPDSYDDAGFVEDDVPFDEDYGEDEEDTGSSFEYRAPFTARRNPVRMWTAAAAIFALLATGTVAAVNYYGMPDWAPFSQPTFGIGKPDLVLEFPAAEQREETLETGAEIFRVRGKITNVGTETMAVPRLLVVFYDERERAVFNKVVTPAKDELAPGESLNVTEAISDIPENADEAAIGWSPG